MQPWVPWIVGSAVFLALYDLAKKASVRDNAVLPVLLISTICGSLAFVVGLVATRHFAAAWAGLDGRVLALGLAKSVIVGTSWIFTFTALRTLPVTIATPIRASAPALVFLLALVLYGEIPSALQAVGMATVFAGYWLFSWSGRAEGIDFLRNRAVWCAVAGAFFSALSAIFDKFVFQVADAPVEPVQLVFQVGLVLVYATCLLVTALAARRSACPMRRFEFRWTIPFVGALLAVADWAYFHGIAEPTMAISVGALVRRLSVVLTFVLGAKIFHERNLVRKGLALSAVVLGIALLCCGH